MPDLKLETFLPINKGTEGRKFWGQRKADRGVVPITAGYERFQLRQKGKESTRGRNAVLQNKALERKSVEHWRWQIIRGLDKRVVVGTGAIKAKLRKFTDPES